jgi:uncharacterized membrane protein
MAAPRAEELTLIPGNIPATLLITAVPQILHPADPFAAEWFSTIVIPWATLLPYLAGMLILVIGLYTFRNELATRRGLDRIVALGPVFVAAPIASFGMEHFTATKAIAGMVPGWLPGHLFWALFVGVCHIGAALSIVIRKYVGITAGLLGLMIFLFVCLIHIPGVAGAPTTTILWVVALRDLAFSGGALSVAAAQAEGWKPQVRQSFILLARLFIAVSVTFLGVEQFLHPKLAPGVPLALLTPVWIPGHAFWGYLTGAIFVVAGVCMMINRKTRLAATWLGFVILLLVVLIYFPIDVGKPDIETGLNYLMDTLLYSGSVLSLAKAVAGDFPLQHQL